MQTWLRHHSYALRIALRRLSLTPFSTISNITVIAFVLALPLLASAVLTSLEPVARTVSVNPIITLFMKDVASIEETQAQADEIKANFADNIQSVEVLSKDQALDSLKSSETWSESLQVLPRNPLPHSIIITLNNTADTEQANALAEQWSALEQVDIVQFDSDWVKKLEGIIYFFKVVLGILAVGVAVVVIATVFNTVRMQALVQRDEIAVARLVGATEAFVQRPFLYLGAITGLCAGLLSIALTAIALSMMNNAIQVLSESYGESFVLRLPEGFWLAFAIVVVMLVAALAARWSVTRHSKF